MPIGSRTDPSTRVKASLLVQIMAEPAFDRLRTKEQLGYIVSCGQWQSSGGSETGIRIVVQSERVPTYLEERVEAFLNGMKPYIEEMKEEEFDEQKESLQKKWTEALKNMKEEANRYWTHIDTGYLDFYRS